MHKSASLTSCRIIQKATFTQTEKVIFPWILVWEGCRCMLGCPVCSTEIVIAIVINWPVWLKQLKPRRVQRSWVCAATLDGTQRHAACLKEHTHRESSQNGWKEKDQEKRNNKKKNFLEGNFEKRKIRLLPNYWFIVFLFKFIHTFWFQFNWNSN